MSARMPSSLLTILALVGMTTSACLRASALTPEDAQSLPANNARGIEQYGKLPLNFEVNQGQVDKRVKFLSRGSGYTLFLTRSAAVLTLAAHDAPASRSCSLTGNDSKPASCPAKTSNSVNGAVVRMELSGARRQTRVTGNEQLAGTSNYLIGNDPSRWHTNVSTYAKVRYTGVYPGIDLVYYGNRGQLEYDFVVAPHAHPDRIRLHFVGADNLRLDAGGKLTVSAKGGSIEFHAPLVYQQHNGRRQTIPGRFTLIANRSVGFQLGSYDHSHPLIVDPVLVYSTYLGGTGFTGDRANAIAVDAQGNAYMTGVTTSTDFPLSTGAFQKSNTFGFMPFVTKLNAAGDALVYSTYLGGTRGDQAYAIAVDALGNAHVGGYTYSPDFPVTAGAYQTTNYGWTKGNGRPDAFITELNPTGTALVYSTFLGGSGASAYGDQVNALVVDSLGNTYATGSTYSSDFPVTTAAFQKTNHGLANTASNAFVAKLNPTLNTLMYSTFLGGSGTSLVGDQGNGLAVDGAGNAYIAGYTFSADFPVTTGALQLKNLGAAKGADTAFITKLNPTGSALIYSTYLGGSGFANQGDGANGLALDSLGNVYVAGYTFSDNFPVTTSAYQKSNLGASVGNSTAFIAKLNAAGNALIYSTYVGGNSGDSANGIVLDAAGNTTIAGQTNSNDFPITTGAVQTSNKAVTTTAFVTRLNAAGSGLLYSTFLGGTGDDYAYAIAADAAGNVYTTGETYSKDFLVTTGAYQTTNRAFTNNGTNLFVTKLNLGGSVVPVPTTTTLTTSANPGTTGVPITLTGTVKANTGTTVPTGNVTFSANGTVLGTVALTSGKAQLTISTSTAGTYAMAAVYGGSTSFGSSSASLSETINLPVAPTPIFAPAAGTYSAAQSVTLTDAVKGAVIYYTINGATPTTASTKYISAIKVSTSTTIKAIAVASGYTNSLVGTATYTITPAALVTLTPTTLAFPNTAIGTTSLGQGVTVKNAGTSTVALTSISLTGTNPTSFAELNTCPASLIAGASCSILVGFKPASAAALHATLSVAHSAAGSPQTVSLSGTGTAALSLTLSKTSLTFPATTVGTTSVPQSVTLTNSGSSTLDITGISLSGVNPGSFIDLSTCGPTLAPATNCVLEVALRPAAKGSLTAILSIADNGSGSPQKVTLTGTGQ